MATVTFKSMIQEASVHLIGCPDYAIENAYRNVAREFCERARVWRGNLTDISIVAGTHTYAPVSPLAHAEVVAVLSADTIIDSVKRELPFRQLDAVKRSYPTWPEFATGTPTVFTRMDNATMSVAPVPDASAGVIKAFAALRPTAVATVWDQDLFYEFRETLLNGVLHKLLLLPQRPWSDLKLAEYRGKQWTFRLNEARIRAERGYNTDTSQVQMRPLA